MTMLEPSLSSLIGGAPLIPVLHVEDVDHAAPLAEALAGAGILALEVTLRTAAALEVIRRMRKAVPGAIIGAGTITRPDQLARVRDAGALFAVSPALTPALAEAAMAVAMPFLPGVATPTEMLIAREYGFGELKFFPADLMGGAGMLKHVQPLFPDLRFCPTGGISDANAMNYLELGNVFAAGGAWLAPRDRIEAGAWADIAGTARRSMAVVSAR